MSRAIAALRAEHRVIERALDALEALASRADPDRAELGALVDFFREYADRWHHGREEDVLFAALVEELPPEMVPVIAELLEDHAEGRRAVAELADTTGPALTAAAKAYATMLRAHILTEDGAVFPLAETRLSEAILEEVDRQFERFEAERPAAGPF